MAYAGGFILSLFLVIYILIYFYQTVERKMFIIKNIFYFTPKQDPRGLEDSKVNTQVKQEMGSRQRMLEASIWRVLTCRGGNTIKYIRQGHRKLRMRMDIAKFLEE